MNEEWLTDKGRFWYDGLKRQRLFAPMVRSHLTGRLEVSSWPEALAAVSEALKNVKGTEMMAIAGKLADAEALVALKDLMTRLGCSKLAVEGEWAGLEADVRSQYLLNTGIANVEDADVALLVGTDPRSEAPLLNTRLRKAAVAGRLRVANIGAPVDLTYPVEQLGETGATLVALAEGRHTFATTLVRAKRPLVIVGAGLLKRADRDSIMAALQVITEQVRAPPSRTLYSTHIFRKKIIMVDPLFSEETRGCCLLCATRHR